MIVHPFDVEIAERLRVRREARARVARVRRRAVVAAWVGSVLCVLLAVAASTVCTVGISLLAVQS